MADTHTPNQQRAGQPARSSEFEPRRYPARRGFPAPFQESPFAFMRRFGEDMDRLFEDFGMGRRFGLSRHGEPAPSFWTPQIEVFQRGDELVVCADLPGLKKEDVKVHLDDGMLTIEGERRAEQTREEKGWRHSERSYGSFYRSVQLPEGIDEDRAKCSFRDGVLEVTIPAPQLTQRQARRLEIHDAGSSPQTSTVQTSGSEQNRPAPNEPPAASIEGVARGGEPEKTSSPGV